MLGKAMLLRIYVSEKESHAQRPLYQYLLQWLREKGIGGATVFRGIEGYGHDKVIHRFQFLEMSSDLPILLEVVESADKIQAILPEVCRMVPKGLVTSSEVTVHKFGGQ